MPTHIQVEFVGPFREITGMKQVVMDIEGQATLGQAIERLTERFGEKFRERVLEEERISEDVIIALNGRPIRPSEVGSVRLSEGDRILVMPESAI